MARRVLVKNVTPEHEEIITKQLLITPKKLSANPKVPEPRPLQCWNVFDECLHLPYLFYTKLNQRIPLELHPEASGDHDCSFMFTGTLRDYQVPLMSEAANHLNEHGSTTLWTHPGSGKTAMGMYLASKKAHRKPTFIVIPKVALIRSWEGTVESFTDAQCYVVPDKKIDVQKLSAAKVVICMDTRFSKLPPGFMHNLGVVIVDECHTFAKTQGRILSILSMVAEYVILETATFEIENGMSKFLRFVAGNHNVRKEYTAPLRIVKVNTRINPKLPDPDIGVLRACLIRHPKYTEWIVKVIKMYVETEKILVLTWLTEQIEQLMPALAAAGIPATSYFGNQKQYYEDKVCVSTLAKTGFGFDEAHHAIDFSGIPFSAVLLPLSVKDSAFYEQVIGRGMRSTNPLFITFIDSHFITRAHWKKNLKWIESHNVKIEKEITLV